MKSATDCGFVSIILSTTSFIAPSSEICTHPFFSIIVIGASGVSNILFNTSFAILLLIVPFSISVISSARCSGVNGISSGSSSFSFSTFAMSDISQFDTAFGFPQIFVDASKKSERCFELESIFASFSVSLYSSRYLCFLLSGNSGKLFFIFSMYSSDSLIATKSGSGKYL